MCHTLCSRPLSLPVFSFSSRPSVCAVPGLQVWNQVCVCRATAVCNPPAPQLTKPDFDSTLPPASHTSRPAAVHSCFRMETAPGSTQIPPGLICSVPQLKPLPQLVFGLKTAVVTVSCTWVHFISLHSTINL